MIGVIQKNKELLIIFLLSLTSRLPQLLSDNLILDGDEALVGIMAKHLMEGKEFPVYFYGQQYGFSLLEVLVIRISYLFAGISDWGIKSSMLLLWTIGNLFFYKTLTQMGSGNRTTALLITIVLILCPAWAVWSMKARGGYLTSYLLFPIITWMLLRKKGQTRAWIYSIIGVLMVILYESQPLWLVGLLPLILFQLGRANSIKNILYLAPGIVLTWLGFYFLKKRASNYWSPEVMQVPNDWFAAIADVPQKLFSHYEGSYYLNQLIEPHVVTTILATIFVGVTFISVGLAIYFFFRSEKKDGLFSVFAVSILGTIGYVIFLVDNHPRYLLPISGLVLMLSFLLADKLTHKLSYWGVFVLFIGVGAFSLFTFKDYSFDAKKELIKKTVNYMLAKDIHHVFCHSQLLQWQVMFYSEEKIVARYYHKRDRYPEYFNRVNEALETPGVNVAILGYYNQPIPKQKVINVEFFKQGRYQYYVFLNPSREILKQHKFKFRR